MKKIQLKMKALEWSQHHSLIFRCSRAANSEVSDGTLPKFKLIQAFMVGLVTCKNEDDPSKKEGDFSRRSRAANSAVCCLILQNFKPNQDIMVVLVTCKNDEDPIIK